MAINFPATGGQATDGSFTYTVAGIVYAWNGSSWQAAGAGASATDRSLFSVTTNSANATPALSYNNNTGVFTYTPPLPESDTLASVTGRGASTSTVLTFNGAINCEEVKLADDKYIKIGSNEDIEIYHSSSNKSVIKNKNEGDYFTFQSGVGTSGGFIFKNEDDDETYAIFKKLGVELYYSDSLKFQTTNTGATITGALTAGGLTYPTTNGNSGQSLVSDGAGNVTWQTASGLAARGTVSSTSALANDGIANVSITTPKTFVLLKVETSHAAWVTLYTDTSSRTADASRQISVDPIPGSGVVAEVITTGAQTQLITPGAICFNSAAAGITYAKIVNKSGSTANVQVTLTYVALEA